MTFIPKVLPDRDLQTRNMLLHIIECVNEIADDAKLLAGTLDGLLAGGAGRDEAKVALVAMQSRLELVGGTLQLAAMENGFADEA